MTGYVPKAPGVMDELKKFQRATAEWAFKRMYGDHDPTHRFLVADEVGLGKTMIARAVIAKTIDHLVAKGDNRIDIVYICSNQSIARQNINKFSDLASDVEDRSDSRLTLLPLRAAKLEADDNDTRINIIPLTPGTSFNFWGGSGSYKERVLLYVMLRRVWGEDLMTGSGQQRFFTAGVSEKRVQYDFDWLCNDFDKKLSTAAVELFRRELRAYDKERVEQGERWTWTEMRSLFDHYRYPKKKYDLEYHRPRNHLISGLRMVLAKVGLESLQPDLIILDEFQRFAELLDTAGGDEDRNRRLERRLFNFESKANVEATRVLLLSATPYRMYTHNLDADGDDHHADFLRTTRFLMDSAADPDAEVDALSHDLRRVRRSLFYGSDDQSLEEAKAASNDVARRLRKVMVRTERLASTPDRNGMLTRVEMPDVAVESDDVRSYLRIAELSTTLGLSDPVEMWKSAPYLVNFMEGYKLKQLLQDEDDPPSPDVVDFFRDAKRFLDPREVEQYQQIDPRNARLRSMVADVVEPGHWEMLWLPPAMPYYKAGGKTGSLYENSAAREFTKRLVFSAWNVVPKTVAALVSYEVERRAFEGSRGKHEHEHSKGYGDRSSGLIELSVVDGRPASLTSMALLYPCYTLATHVDPRELVASCPTADMQLRKAREVIEPLLSKITAGSSTAGEIDRRWYAVAQTWLDHQREVRWLDNGANDLWEPARASDGLSAHVKELRRLADHPEELRSPPSDLVDVLAKIAIAGPGTTALRSLLRHFPRDTDVVHGLMTAAARVTWGVRSLLNTADVTAMLRRRYPDRDYWRLVIDHGIDGNFQAVLDEYVHVLRGWRHVIGDSDETAKRIAADIAAVLSVRTVDYRTDIPRAVNGSLEFEHLSLRARYAVRFGDRQYSDDQSLKRKDLIGLAFNSPFWPFVMTTTSVGQEGLDFHQYCHAVVHWNLPSNPVDLEQREGRVHRFKGHAVRKNVAQHTREQALASPDADPWAAAFEFASKMPGNDGSEIVPYWVFNPDGQGAKIERRVPMLPMSREHQQLQRLIDGLVSYRLAFGQPRQEELVRFLGDRRSADQLANAAGALGINLGPPPLANEPTK